MIATVTGTVSYQYDDEAFDDFTDEELIETSRESMIQSAEWGIEWTVVRVASEHTEVSNGLE